MGRPLKKIDREQVLELARINCTMDEMAAVLKCSKDTLERRFAATIKEGREEGKSSLKRLMWEAAKQGNITMMIFLSKQLLGYSDKVESNMNATVSPGPALTKETIENAMKRDPFMKLPRPDGKDS